MEVNTKFPIGQDIKGNSYLADLLSISHLLITGATGVGKSVFVDTILLSLIENNTPEQIRLVLCDTKQIQMQPYCKVNHMLLPLCTDAVAIAGIIQALLTEAKWRIEKFSQAGKKNITDYNELLMSHYGKFLPRIVCVIDDLSTVLQVSDGLDEVISTLISVARTVGIHIIAVTQTPSAKETKKVASLFLTKAMFQTASAAERRFLTGSTGAFDLRDVGDYIFLSGPVRIQTHVVPFSDDAMDRIISKNQGKTNYSRSFIQEVCRNNSPAQSEQPSINHVSYENAVECVIEAGQASASLLQRRLKLGYAEAARLMDIMEQEKIIGPYEGAKPRSVLITWAQWMERKNDR